MAFSTGITVSRKVPKNLAVWCKIDKFYPLVVKKKLNINFFSGEHNGNRLIVSRVKVKSHQAAYFNRWETCVKTFNGGQFFVIQ